MRKLYALAALLALAAAPRLAHATITPLTAGWTAQQVADGLVTPMGEMAVDPVTHDAFVMDHTGTGAIVYRVTLAGTRTAVVSGMFVMDVFAFDPAARELILASPAGLERYSETGAFAGTLPGGASALAIGPDGALYGTYGAMIRRFDAGAQSWQDWRALASPFLTILPDGLSFAPDGRPFVRMGGMVFRADEGATTPIAGLFVRMGVCASATGVLVGPFVTGLDAPASTATPGTLWVNSDNTSGLITGLATDADGRIYLTAIGTAVGHGSVWVLSPPGVVSAHATTWGALKAAYR